MYLAFCSHPGPRFAFAVRSCPSRPRNPGTSRRPKGSSRNTYGPGYLTRVPPLRTTRSGTCRPCRTIAHPLKIRHLGPASSGRKERTGVTRGEVRWTGRNPGQDTKKIRLQEQKKLVPATIRIAGLVNFFSRIHATTLHELFFLPPPPASEIYPICFPPANLLSVTPCLRQQSRRASDTLCQQVTPRRPLSQSSTPPSTPPSPSRNQNTHHDNNNPRSPTTPPTWSRKST